MSKEKLEIRKRYGSRVKVSAKISGESRAKQAFKDECDINNILKKYKKTGILPVAEKAARYGDFSNVSDYQTAVNTVMNAQEAFLELPSKVRARFENDPAQFLAFMADENNTEEAIKLGLAQAKPQDVVAPSQGAGSADLPPAKPVPPVTT